MNHSVVALLALPLIAPTASAGDITFPVEQPSLKVDCAWTYSKVDLRDNTVGGEQTITILGETPDGYVAEFRQTSGFTVTVPEALSRDLGWKKTIDGQKTDNGWLNFPLTAGKTWHATDLFKTADGYPGHYDITYKVIGVGPIKVPAGTFEAVEIRGDGYWSRDTKPRSSGTAEQHLWYSPQVKGIVRFEWKNTVPIGQQNFAYELTSFKLQ